MKSILVFGLLVLTVSADLAKWSDFKLKHEKKYVNVAEETTRYSIFQNNLKTIQEHNEKYDAGKVTWKMGINHFADLTPDEFKARLPAWDMNALHEVRNKHNFTKFTRRVGDYAPDSIDWRSYGAVTEVKNQGNCGGCWTFSATGTLEGQYFRRYGQLVSLSEQNLLDCCDSSYGNSGCGGGVVGYSFDYITNNGIQSEDDYPYEAVQDICRFDQSRSITSCNGYTEINSGDEEALIEAVGTIGPISIALNADDFQFYSSGVYSDTSCSNQVNHGVLAVGYDSEDGMDYWIVKNSWGEDFGEYGYIRMIRGYGICGIDQFALYPNL